MNRGYGDEEIDEPMDDVRFLHSYVHISLKPKLLQSFVLKVSLPCIETHVGVVVLFHTMVRTWVGREQKYPCSQNVLAWKGP